MPQAIRPRPSMDLGGPSRVTNYGSWYQGVNAQAPDVRASVPRGRVPSQAGQGIATAISHAVPKGLPFPHSWGRKGGYPTVSPKMRLGSVPKMSVGSGQTAAQPANALGYTPGGWTPPHQYSGPGMQMMPYLRENFNSARASYHVPSGFPLWGVGAVDGNVTFAPTYHAHDFAIAHRFAKQGRMPGAWVDQSFPPTYRPLQPMSKPRTYAFPRGIAMARPLAPNSYFLGYQTSFDVAARIGGGTGGRPLGY